MVVVKILQLFKKRACNSVYHVSTKSSVKTKGDNKLLTQLVKTGVFKIAKNCNQELDLVQKYHMIIIILTA